MEDKRLKFFLMLARTINPQINHHDQFRIDTEQLRHLPDGTLGREVARFLDENGFDPINSGDFVQRSHDVWHVLTGLSNSEADELKIQAFARAQVFRPTSTILILAGLLTKKCHFNEIKQAFKKGRFARKLINWNIESDWETPLAEVREKLGITILD
ncbi:Coq4 family protein [Lyngbya aestuarii]|uniref:Coq4 family protein n=1 Tax=Lyngbya aestuarii TaxID=118322 RepID=UPI00403DACC4